MCEHKHFLKISSQCISNFLWIAKPSQLLVKSYGFYHDYKLYFRLSSTTFSPIYICTTPFNKFLGGILIRPYLKFVYEVYCIISKFAYYHFDTVIVCASCCAETCNYVFQKDCLQHLKSIWVILVSSHFDVIAIKMINVLIKISITYVTVLLSDWNRKVFHVLSIINWLLDKQSRNCQNLCYIHLFCEL